jgi:uncharacterized membrane protein
MELIEREKVKHFIPLAKILCVLAAFGCTGILLFKWLYFSTWDEKKETIIYSIPLVFLLFIWAKNKLDEKNIFHRELIMVDAAVILLAGIRVLGLLFHSGHVLFLLYTYITTPNKTYRLLCWPMIIVTAYFKIFYWGDFFTPIIGAIMAMLFVSLRKKVNNKIEEVEKA